MANGLRIYLKEALMSSREAIDPHKGDKRYARRGRQGQFTEKQFSVGKSLAADRRTKAKATVAKGWGDEERS
jgi:hypothetical protein